MSSEIGAAEGSMSVREYMEQSDATWTRAERRRLARAGSAPGRRFGARVPVRKPWTQSGTRGDIERAAVLAVPGLRPRDIDVGTPEPGRVRVRLSGPAASERAARAVYQALWRQRPVGVALEVEAGVTVESAALE